MRWTVQKFDTAQGAIIWPVQGWVRRGLGLYKNQIEEWWVVHLNSGHGVCRLIGSFSEVMAVADEIEEAADWSFDSLTGWQNRNPDLMRRLAKIKAENPEVAKLAFRKGGDPNGPNAATARAIAGDEW